MSLLSRARLLSWACLLDCNCCSTHILLRVNSVRRRLQTSRHYDNIEVIVAGVVIAKLCCSYTLDKNVVSVMLAASNIQRNVMILSHGHDSNVW